MNLSNIKVRELYCLNTYVLDRTYRLLKTSGAVYEILRNDWKMNESGNAPVK